MVKKRKTNNLQTGSSLEQTTLFNGCSGMAPNITDDSLKFNLVRLLENSQMSATNQFGIKPRNGFDTLINLSKILDDNKINNKNIQSVGVYGTSDTDAPKFISLIDGEFITSDGVIITNDIKTVETVRNNIDKKITDLFSYETINIAEIFDGINFQFLFGPMMVKDNLEISRCPSIVFYDNEHSITIYQNNKNVSMHTPEISVSNENFYNNEYEFYWNWCDYDGGQEIKNAYEFINFLATKDFKIAFKVNGLDDIPTKGILATNIKNQVLSLLNKFQYSLISNKTSISIKFKCELKRYYYNGTDYIGINDERPEQTKFSFYICDFEYYTKIAYNYKDALPYDLNGKMIDLVPYTNNFFYGVNKDINPSYQILYEYISHNDKNPFKVNKNIKYQDWIVFNDNLYCISGDEYKGIIEFPFNTLSSQTPKAKMITPYVPTANEVALYGNNCLGDGGWVEPIDFENESNLIPRLANVVQRLDGRNFLDNFKIYSYYSSNPTIDKLFIQGSPINNKYQLNINDLMLVPSNYIKLKKPVNVVGQDVNFSINIFDVQKFMVNSKIQIPLIKDGNFEYSKLLIQNYIIINPKKNNGEDYDPTIYDNNGWDLTKWNQTMVQDGIYFTNWPNLGSDFNVDITSNSYILTNQDFTCYSDKFSFISYNKADYISKQINYKESNDFKTDGDNGDGIYNNLKDHLEKAIDDYIKGIDPKIYISFLVADYRKELKEVYVQHNMDTKRCSWLENLVIRLGEIKKSNNTYDLSKFNTLTLNSNFYWNQSIHKTFQHQFNYSEFSTNGNNVALNFKSGDFISYSEKLSQVGKDKEIFILSDISAPDDYKLFPELNISTLSVSEFYEFFPIQNTYPTTIPKTFCRWLFRPVPEGTTDDIVNGWLNVDPLTDIQKPINGATMNLNGWSEFIPTYPEAGEATVGIQYKIDKDDKTAEFMTNMMKFFPESEKFIICLAYYNEKYGNPYTVSDNIPSNNINCVSKTKLFNIKLDDNFKTDFLEQYEINKCQSSYVDNGTLILYNNPEKPSRFYLSQPRNFSYFPNNRYIDLPLYLNEKIIKIIPLQNILILFTNLRIFHLKYDKDLGYIVKLVNNNIGTISKNSIASYRDSLFFLWQNNMYELVNPFLSANYDDRIANIKQVGNGISDLLEVFNKSTRRNDIRLFSNQTNNELRFFIPNYRTINGITKALIISYNPKISIMENETNPISGFGVLTSRGKFISINNNQEVYDTGIFDDAQYVFTWEDYYIIYNDGVFYVEENLETTDFYDKKYDPITKTTEKYSYALKLMTKKDNLDLVNYNKAFLNGVLIISFLNDFINNKNNNISDLDVTINIWVDNALIKNDDGFPANIDLTNTNEASLGKENENQQWILGQNKVDDNSNSQWFFNISGNGYDIQLGITINGKKITNDKSEMIGRSALCNFDLRTLNIKFSKILQFGNSN